MKFDKARIANPKTLAHLNNAIRRAERMRDLPLDDKFGDPKEQREYVDAYVSELTGLRDDYRTGKVNASAILRVVTSGDYRFAEWDEGGLEYGISELRNELVDAIEAELV